MADSNCEARNVQRGRANGCVKLDSFSCYLLTRDIAWNKVLEEELLSSPPMHVSILCVEDDSACSTLSDAIQQSPLPPSSGSHSDAPTKNQLLVSARNTHMLSGLRCLPTSHLAPSFFAFQNCVSEEDETSHPLADLSLPLETVCLVFSHPADMSTRNESRGYLFHLFQIAGSLRSSYTKSSSETLIDICKNIHELSVLSSARWRLDERSGSFLPYHLSSLQLADSLLDLADAMIE